MRLETARGMLLQAPLGCGCNSGPDEDRGGALHAGLCEKGEAAKRVYWAIAENEVARSGRKEGNFFKVSQVPLQILN